MKDVDVVKCSRVPNRLKHCGICDMRFNHEKHTKAPEHVDEQKALAFLFGH